MRSSGTPVGATTVTFSSPVSSADYRVSWIITSDTDFGPTSGWGYLFASGKTVNGFTITLNDGGGNAKNAPADTIIDWIALPSN